MGNRSQKHKGGGLSFFDFFYALLLILVSPAVLIKSIIKRDFRKRVLLRLFINQYYKLHTNLEIDSSIWVHAASVGEVRLAVRLIKAYKEIVPDQQFVVTTNTIDAFESARKESFFYSFIAPLDFSFPIRRFIKQTHAKHLVLIETEIWPNMIRWMSQKGEVVIINGRLSDRHFNNYLKLKPLLKNTLSRISYVLARDTDSTDRFIQLGISPEQVPCLGNLKFEYPVSPPDETLKQLQQKYQIDQKQFIFVAGSIQPEELIPIVDSWQKLNSQSIKFRLFIIPRHPDKIDEFKKNLERMAVKYYISSQQSYTDELYINNPVHIIDEIGVLLSWYQLGNASFVGGSLCDRGGQNMLEPIGLKKPVCIGPNAVNFKQEVNLLQQADGVQIIHNESDLSGFILKCYQKPDQMTQMGERGYQVIIDQAEAMSKNVKKLKEIFST